MAGNDAGFYTLERRLIDEMRGDPVGYLVWTYLIGKANWVDSKPKKLFGGDRRVIRRGQILTSVDKIAKHWRLEETAVRRRLKKFEADGFITQEVRPHSGRIITILNYDKYQGKRLKGGGAEVPAGIENGATDDKDKDKTPVADDECRNTAGIGVADTPELESTTRRNSAGPTAGFPFNPSAEDDEGINPAVDEVAGNLPDRLSRTRRNSSPGHAGIAPPYITSDQGTTDHTTKGITGERTRSRKRATEARTSKSGPTLKAYLDAMELLHGVRLPAEASLRSMACTLVDRIGAEAAPDVAEWYVTHEREAWIVRARHPFGELLKNWQKYYTNCKSGTKVSGSMAKAVERNDANQTALDRLLAREQAQATAVGGQFKT